MEHPVALFRLLEREFGEKLSNQPLGRSFIESYDYVNMHKHRKK